MSTPAPQPRPFAPPALRRKLGLAARTTLLAWLVATATLLIFAIAIVPEQKRAFLDHLRSKANAVAVALRDVVAAAAVNDDYSSVVDACSQIIEGDPSIAYLVLIRHDGFSLVHDHDGWRALTQHAVPSGDRVPGGGIREPPLAAQRVYHYAQPFDYSGIKWGWINVGLSVAEYDRSVERVYWRTGLLTVVCGALGLVASAMYARHVVRPILALQAVVRRVAHGDLSARAVADRTDELGELAASVNAMTEALLRRDRRLQDANETLEQRVADRTQQLQQQIAAKQRAHNELAEAQHRLMQLSREAGMAEVATGILHNVGNVLNSVNVSATLVQDQLAQSELRGLQRAIDLLRTHRDDLPRYLVEDPHGRHLPAYLIEVGGALHAEHAAWQAELASLATNIGHIKEIVAMQQSYARVSGVIETLPPRLLAEDAIKATAASFARRGIAVATEFEPAPDVGVDKHKVLQILFNLLTNAEHAVAQLPPGEARITVAVRTAGPTRVQIAVADNGVGIPPENLALLFSQRFTTRKNGHGFGLHSGALAARELGGSLTAHSDGPGRGALFILELPTDAKSSRP